MAAEPEPREPNNVAEESINLEKLEVDRAHLYREDVFTDLRVATIRRLVPVKPDGSEDPSREMIFSAETQILTPQGPLPIHVPIEAKTLEEALDKFSTSVQQGLDRLVEEARQLRRESGSRIITPGEAGLGPIVRGR